MKSGSDDWGVVLDEWRRAVEDGDTRPNRTVAQRLSMNKRSVEAIVYAARKMGMLPPTTQGRVQPACICPTCGDSHTTRRRRK